MSDEESEETIGQLQEVPGKLAEAAGAGFRDRSKRRLSLPLSSLNPLAGGGSRKSSITSNDPTANNALNVEGGGRHSRRGSRRRSSFSSTESW